jgi:putative DNA primase/helicase
MLDTALAWQHAGYSVIRASTNGKKATVGEWADNMRRAADATTVTAWFHGGHPGLGIVCGAVSGNLEMLEIEGRAMVDGTGAAFFAALDDHGLADIKARIVAGYSETSPSGGIHLLFRVAGVPVAGNTKLAQRPNPDPVGTPKRWPLIETRGEGGYVIVAPSHGPVHETGRPWVQVSGSPGTVATITADEYEALHGIARLFDEIPPPPPMPDPVSLDTRRAGGGLQPGDDYNTRATWDEIMTPAGWVIDHRTSTRTLWRRPGKTVGVSAVTGGPTGDYLWVWTTSTELPTEAAMSKFRAYTLLHHEGDFHRSAKALSAAGYGEKAPEPQRPVLTVLPGYGADSGALATLPATAPATTHARTDDAMALALVDEYGPGIRYCPERCRWLRWLSPYWTWCPPGGGVLREMVKLIGRSLGEHDAADVRHKIHVLSAPGTTNILSQAATDPRVIVHLAELDALPYELNTPGGMVDLRTGALSPPDPSHLHTRITRATPDPAADPTLWTRFLADTFADHDDIAGYVQRLVGYSAIGVVLDHVLPFCFGAGQNGKSVFLDALMTVLGDYASTAPAGFLMAQNYAKHETELADLAGTRFVVCGELNERDKFDEARVKSLTGGDSVKARFMRQDYFTFTPTHHLWLMGNDQPAVGKGGPAFWRRVRIIPFDHTVPETQRIVGLADILARDHGSAIMSWLATGAMDYLRDGLQEPAGVHVATGEYEHDQDSVGRFVEERCHIGGGENVTTTIALVRTAYERWCAAESLTPVGARTLGLTLRHRYGVAYTTGGRAPRRYVGIALIPEDWPQMRKDLT